MIKVDNITVNLGGNDILKNLSLDIPKGQVTVILGPNGCGKSTLLKAIARINPLAKGNIFLNSENIHSAPSRKFAQQLAILTQSPQSPADLTVNDLVSLGRFPYHTWWKKATKEDENIVLWALEETNLLEFRGRVLSTLSGGEKQRAWIAMALAQQPEVLLLDEPTTYLDICHQLEVMQILARLNKELNLTVVMVLHDINHAIHYADYVAVMKKGVLQSIGDPVEIVTPELLKSVFNVKVDSFTASNGLPVVLPIDLID